MAGRSGAAAIEMSLREAAEGFDSVAMKKLAERVRSAPPFSVSTSASDDTALADALCARANDVEVSRQVKRNEGECLLTFNADEDGMVDIRKGVTVFDCSSLAALEGCGMEVLVRMHGPAGEALVPEVVAVSFYLE